MKVLPIISNQIFNKPNINKKQQYTTQPKIDLQFYTVSFKSSAKNAEPLRELMKFGMVDFWTGKPVINPEFFSRILKYKMFSFPLKNVITALNPVEKTLHEVPAQIFTMLKEYAKINPGTKLDEVFKQWAPYANIELKKLQEPIFKKLKKYSLLLPEKQKADFDSLMELTKAQINSKTILMEFNKKDFLYKLERISQGIKQRNIPDEISAMNKIIKLGKEIPETDKNSSTKRIHKNKLKAQKNFFHIMNNYFERSVLSDDKELLTLFYNIKCQLLEIPAFIPFSRKNFIEDLNNILKNLEDKSLKEKMTATAESLPTSTEHVSAFIVKAARQSCEKIGYDIFHGSVGNIDHLIVKSRGGKHSVDNYVISSNYINSLRSNKSVKSFMRNNPLAYKGAQKYFERMYELYRKGFIKKVGLSKEYLIDLISTVESLSPKERPLKINCDKFNF